MLERAQYLLPAFSYLTMKNKALGEYSLDSREKKYLGLIIEFLKTLGESTIAVELRMSLLSLLPFLFQKDSVTFSEKTRKASILT
jgi:hypothetical protein